MWFIYTVEYYSALKVQGDSTTCDNMDAPGGHYAKWGKPDTGQILRDLIYVRNLKQSTSQKLRVWQQLGQGGGEAGAVLVKGSGVQDK